MDKLFDSGKGFSDFMRWVFIDLFKATYIINVATNSQRVKTIKVILNILIEVSLVICVQVVMYFLTAPVTNYQR